MGNRLSAIAASIAARMARGREETPQQILGIDRSATLAETKKAYCRVSYASRHSPDTLNRINEAYEQCRRSIDWSVYDQSALDTAYLKYAVDFFDRLEAVYGIHGPLAFSDGDFQRFYRFWNTFRHEDERIERRVHRIIREIKKRDPRTSRSTAGTGTERGTDRQPQSAPRQPRTYAYHCVVCDRGFGGEKTLADHLRSRRHREGEGGGRAAVWLAGREAIAEAIGRNIVKHNKPGTEEPGDMAGRSTRPDAAGCTEEAAERRSGQPTHRAAPPAHGGWAASTARAGAGPSDISREHPAYRTCSHCQRVCETRGALILHIRREHPR